MPVEYLENQINFTAKSKLSQIGYPILTGLLGWFALTQSDERVNINRWGVGFSKWFLIVIGIGLIAITLFYFYSLIFDELVDLFFEPGGFSTRSRKTGTVGTSFGKENIRGFSVNMTTRKGKIQNYTLVIPTTAGEAKFSLDEYTGDVNTQRHAIETLKSYFTNYYGMQFIQNQMP